VTGGDVLSKANADTATVAVANAINDIQSYRATIGASQNRLQFAAANLATTTENTEAARSQLLDLDVAAEMSVFTSKQILVQAGVAMLAQANQLPQNLLRLFQ
jgi:flagellin